MAKKRVRINRAPVLTLWAVIVAERLGYSPEESLTFGKAVAGMNAQSKGRRLGVYDEPEGRREERRDRKRKGEQPTVKIMNRKIPVVNTGQGLRAVVEAKQVLPSSVRRYLEEKFGKNLVEVRQAMVELAESFEPDELEVSAYKLYEEFRPTVPEGLTGWGAAGELDLELIRSLAE